jgi:hypothetical protein
MYWQDVAYTGLTEAVTSGVLKLTNAHPYSKALIQGGQLVYLGLKWVEQDTSPVVTPTRHSPYTNIVYYGATGGMIV